jgi:hypothetical protein
MLLHGAVIQAQLGGRTTAPTGQGMKVEECSPGGETNFSTGERGRDGRKPVFYPTLLGAVGESPRIQNAERSMEDKRCRPRLFVEMGRDAGRIT